MSEYYAVIRSTDHLAHYGVKGMKWGVRKAVVMGNQKKLDRHFKKAAKKLAKLQDKALHSGKYAAKAVAYGAAAAGTGSIAIGNSAVSKYLQKRFAPHSRYIDLYNKYVEPHKHNTKIRVGAGIATAGLGALAAKNAYIASHKGKYMSKADDFRRSMDEAFSGTKYQGQYIAPPKKKKKRR